MRLIEFCLLKNLNMADNIRMGMKSYITLLFAFCFSVGCQTSQLVQYKKIHPGMEKHDVLELMGSPQSTQRWQGKDRWSYIFYDENIRFEKEVHFTEGVSTYVGDKPAPTITAAQQDQINQESNQQLAKQEEETKLKTQNSYQQYEDSVKGETATGYVPQFEPVQ